MKNVLEMNWHREMLNSKVDASMMLDTNAVCERI